MIVTKMTKQYEDNKDELVSVLLDDETRFKAHDKELEQATYLEAR